MKNRIYHRIIIMFVMCLLASVSGFSKSDDKPSPKEDQDKRKYARFELGAMGAYNFFSKSFGVEFRTHYEMNRIFLPVDFLSISGSTRIKALPAFFFTDRKDERSKSALVSVYYEQNTVSTTFSSYEVGIGGGYSMDNLRVTGWVSKTFNSGTTSVKEIFNIRVAMIYNPLSFFNFEWGLRIGTGVLTGSSYSTSGTLAEIDLLLGFRVIRVLKIVVGAEAKTNNIGGFLNSSASVAGLSDAIQVLLKLGVTFEFDTKWF